MREQVRARGEGVVDINVDQIDREADIGRKELISDKAMGAMPILMQNANVIEAKLKELFKSRD